MQSDIIAIGIAYALGIAARFIGLPPMVGYLVAGFVLYAGGGQITPTLKEFSNLGVTLLLFSIGLKLRIKNLLMPQIWAVASIHMVITVTVSALFIFALGILGIAKFFNLDPVVVTLIAFALSFSSTVFAVKVLEDQGKMNSLYGRISIGILIIQDIAAVLFLAISTGKIPSLWAIGLFALIPLRPILYYLLEKSGRGELLILFGLILALGGAEIFELVSVKGDLGALILGVMIANHVRASELAKHLLGFKDLFLVGFFLSIGLSGPLSWDTGIIALLLLLLIPFKTVLFFSLLSKFNLRVRTSLLSSVTLANYSEFGLIVIAISISNGWLNSEWLIILAITLSLSFIVAAPLNAASYYLYAKNQKFLSRFETPHRIQEEQDINPGKTNVIVFGMGRVGSSAYEAIHQHMGDQVLGVDIDEQRIKKLHDSGKHVIHGSATDPEFWNRINLDFKAVKLILLAMPNTKENIFAAQLLKEEGYTGKLAAIAKYKDEVDVLKQAGVHSAFNLYDAAGVGFADHVGNELWQDSNNKTD
ncbi:MAG: cation:proton antiporter [Gammaproteobacteria bacterium]